MGATMAVASAGVTLMAANQQRKAFQMQAAQYEEQREMSKLQTDADVLARQNSLFYQLSSLNAAQAGGNVSVGNFGDSGSAFRTNEKKLASNDIRNIKLMGYTQQRNFGLSAAMARSSAQSSMLSGIAGATGTIGGAVMKSPGPRPGTFSAFRRQIKNEWT